MPWGQVKEKWEANEEYLVTMEEHSWYPLVLNAHARLYTCDPDYTIIRISDQGNHLHYEFDSTKDEDTYQLMQQVVNEVALQVEQFEHTHRELKNLVKVLRPNLPQETFIEAVLAGRADLADADEWVDMWHGSGGASSLDEFLGFTEAEGTRFAERPEELPDIVADRKKELL